MSQIASPRRIAIVGGGLSGLATAVQLQLAFQDSGSGKQDSHQPTGQDFEITVFEAGNRAGGVIHTEQVGDFLIDHGADMFATKPSAALELVKRLGAESKLIQPQPTRRGARIVSGGKLVPIPEGFVLMRATRLIPMLTTPLLSLRGKLRFLAERWVAPIQRNADNNPLDDESVESFVRRRMGEEVLQKIVAPLSAGIYTADISKLSMRSTMGPIYEMERQFGSLAKATKARQKSGEDSIERASTGARYGQFRAFAGGSIELIQTLVQALPEGSLRLNTPISSITPSPEKAGPPEKAGCWDLSGPTGTIGTYDHVVIALPPHAAERLLHDVVPGAAKSLAEIEAASTAIVVLCLRRQDVGGDIETFGFVVPATENRRVLAGSFASHKFAGRAPEDALIVRVFIGGALQPELLEQDDDQLVQIACEELAEIIGFSGEPIVTKVVRWNHAMPQYHVGHHQKVERIEAAMSDAKGLTLMNNAMHGVGIAPVIARAGKVAQLVCAELKSGGGLNND